MASGRPVGDESLFGHSLGALLVLHAAVHAPDSFDTYVAASLPMRIGGGAVWKEAAAFEAGPARATRLLATVGALESHPAPAFVDDYRRWYAAHPEAIPGQTVEEALADLFPDDPAYDKVADTRALVERLARHGMRADFFAFPDEEHTASAVNALNRAVPFALRPEPRE